MTAELLRDAVQALIRAQHTLVVCYTWIEPERQRGYVGMASADAFASLTYLAGKLSPALLATLHIPTPGAR